MEKLISSTDSARQLNELVGHVGVTVNNLKTKFDDEQLKMLRDGQDALMKREEIHESNVSKHVQDVNEFSIEKERVEKMRIVNESTISAFYKLKDGHSYDSEKIKNELKAQYDAFEHQEREFQFKLTSENANFQVQKEKWDNDRKKMLIEIASVYFELIIGVFED